MEQYNGAALKIERAKHHIVDLERELEEFLTQQPFETIIQQDPSAGKKFIKIKTNKPIPIELSLIIGDVVHNLRSALDLLIFSLVGDKTGRPRSIQFPFASDQDKFEEAIVSRQINLAGEKVVDAVRSRRPYPKGNDLLWGLHELDICDKHKLILPTANVTSITADDLGKLDPSLSFIKGPGVLKFVNLENGVMFDIVLPTANRSERRARRAFEEKTKHQPDFTICFGKGQPFEGRIILPLLEKLVHEVEITIEGIISA